MKQKEFYRRKLPHWQPIQSTFFITYRLAGSLPISKINELRIQRNALISLGKSKQLSTYQLNLLNEELFKNLDEPLDQNLNGPYWLNDNAIAQLVLDSLKFNDGKAYSLWGATVMPNHVHTLLSTYFNSPPLNTILQNHKKFTATHANKILHREGQFWQRESFDKIIWNDQQFENTVEYMINNPVKARLIDYWKKWPWTYLHPLISPQYI